MAGLIWTEPALGDLDAIADYIALDKPDAARELVRRIFKHVEQLIEQPEAGPRFPSFADSDIARSWNLLAAFSTGSTASKCSFSTFFEAKCSFRSGSLSGATSGRGGGADP